MKNTTSSRLIHYTTKPIHWIIKGSYGIRSVGLFVFLLPLLSLGLWKLATLLIPKDGVIPCTLMAMLVMFICFLSYNTVESYVKEGVDFIALKPVPIKPVLQDELVGFMSKARQARSFEELEFYCQTLRLTATEMLTELNERKEKMEKSIAETDRQLRYLNEAQPTPFRIKLKESHQKTSDFLAQARINIRQAIADAVDMSDYLEATLTGLEAKANVRLL